MSPSAPEIASYDVAIIGLGPVGATLANILGLYGISTIVFERHAATYSLPRAAAFDDEIMRVFQSIGLADDISEIATVGGDAHFVDGDGSLLVNWSRAQKVSPNGWYINNRFHQPSLDNILRRGLERFPSVSVLAEHDVSALDEGEDAVTVHYKNLSTGTDSQVSAAFVVGCDGAHSLTRDAIDSAFEDLGFHEPWLVVDLVLQKPRPDLDAHSVHHCDPERSATYVYIGGGRRRWEFRLQPDDDPAQIIDPDNVWHLLRKWIGPDEAELERAVVYTFHSYIAEKWRQGRILIAGDAAHQMPPFMGQGMCAGIRDGANLGWKLDRILKGTAGIELLETYESERKPHVRTVIDLTINMGQLLNTTASSIVSGSAAQAAEGPQKVAQVLPNLGPGLTAGDGKFTGRLFPQPRLLSGERLDDHIGPRPALILRNEFARQLSTSVMDSLAPEGIAVIDEPSPEILAWFETNNVQAVLIRPDRYILGTADTSEELSELLQNA